MFQPVNKVLTQNDEAVGVVLEDGTEIRSKVILSNATPKVTFVDLLPKVHYCKLIIINDVIIKMMFFLVHLAHTVKSDILARLKFRQSLILK